MNYSINMECYHFEKIQYNSGLFDSCIEATYIIHLEGNGRFKNILEQLRQYKPSKIVYILHNKGYLNCVKPNYITNTSRDLVDANFTVFKHAEQNHYGNILILEDDFFFNDRVNSIAVRDRICYFINVRKNSSFVYSLGCLPFVSIPWSVDGYHYLVPFFCATHSCIFTKSYRINSLAIDQSTIWDWDQYTRIGYMYCEPICYQIFPETENKKQWGTEYYNFLFIFIFVSKLLITILNLDKHPEPGYSIVYAYSKFLFYFWLLCIILFVWFMKRFFYRKSK